jgi:multicomponent Na+:H+ antiporter subunit A
MEAPTPVSAYLHSATMVQAGVYLLLRMQPAFAGLTAWTMTLTVAGSITLLWGAVMALKQTDLKQVLARTTLASLGLLVLLIGIGATEAALVYFVAHALYKAALFLVAGTIDHQTGARDLTALGGLRNRMPATFLAAIAASVSMIGLPPALGFFGKEEAYHAALGDPVVLAVLIAGNALMVAVALAMAIRPFTGALHPTPQEPREGGMALLVGPLVLAAGGVAAPWLNGSFGVEAHLNFKPFDPMIVLSILTWGLGAVLYWRLDAVRVALQRMAEQFTWTFEKGFDAVMFGLIRLAAAATRTWHHGRLELYLVVVFATMAVAIGGPMLTGGLPTRIAAPDLTFYEWAVVALAAAGVIAVLMAWTRLFAIVALGAQGLAVALLYLLFGAPDLSFTQFMIEILSVVILALVMTRLRLEREDRRQFEDLLRDGTIALLCGAGIVALLFAMLESPFDPRLSDFFAANSAVHAHGRNIVNVIIVDFRGLDTLGEIAVVMIAGIAILSLIRHEPRPPSVATAEYRRRRQTGKPA